MSDPDPERIDLRAPLPEGALSARVVFKASRMGLDRTVKRSVATHADVALEFIGPRTQTRRLAREEVEAFLAEAARLHAEGDRRDAEHRERAVAAREARAELAAAGIDLSCPRCGVPRAFEGRRDLLSAGSRHPWPPPASSSRSCALAPGPTTSTPARAAARSSSSATGRSSIPRRTPARRG